MERALSTPFSLAQTFAAARAVLFSPNSTTVYKLPSNLMIMPRLMSAVFAILAVRFCLCYTIKNPSRRQGVAKICSRPVKRERGANLHQKRFAANILIFSGAIVDGYFG